MKIKKSVLAASLESGALQRLTEMHLPAGTAFRIKPIVLQCNLKMNEFITARNAIFAKHEWPQEGDQWKAPVDKPDAIGAAVEEIEALADEEIEIVGQQLTSRSFLSSSSFSVQDLITLEWLIDSGEAKEAAA